jgi:methionyl-tRNA formyltransferase
MIKCVLLTTDTKHHRYFANRIAEYADVTVILELEGLNYRKLYWKWVKRHRSLSSFINNPYIHLRYDSFQRLQDEFEEKFFSEGISRDFARLAGVHEFDSVNNPQCVDLLKELSPDLIVSFGTGLIKQGILQLQPLKINIHRGILPKYRGLDSDLWAFYCLDFDNVGTTVHKLEAHFDTGNILGQQKLKIQPGMKVHQIRYYTTVIAADLVENVIQKMREPEETEGFVQDLSQSSYYSFMPPLKRLLAIRRFNRYVQSLT